MPPVRGVVEGEVDNRCVDIIRFPIGLSSLPNIFRASERVSITEFGVCEAVSHEPCTIWGVNTLL